MWKLDCCLSAVVVSSVKFCPLRNWICQKMTLREMLTGAYDICSEQSSSKKLDHHVITYHHIQQF